MDLAILKGIQTICCQPLDTVFKLFSILTEEYVSIVLVCVVYWLISKRVGVYMCYSLTTSLLLNNTLKNIFLRPRPIGVEGVRSIYTDTATGTSFPSGHSQSVSSMYISMARGFNKKWLYILTAAIALLCGFSRLYLGVHWPSDVIAGLLLGTAAAFLAPYAMDSKHKHIITFATAVIGTVLCLFIEDKSLVTAAGLSTGFAVGMLLEEKYVRFSTDIPIKKKILRFLVGVVIVAVVYLAPKFILPSLPIIRYLRYAALALCAAYAAPLVFIKLKI